MNIVSTDAILSQILQFAVDRIHRTRPTVEEPTVLSYLITTQTHYKCIHLLKIMFEHL